MPDGELNKLATQYVEEGQAITLYMGHSGPEGFFAAFRHFMDRHDWARVKIARGPGVFASFGCNACQLRGRDGEGYGLAASVWTKDIARGEA